MSWSSLPLLDPDGANLPLSVAADLFDVKISQLRKAVKERGLEPSGVIRMDDFRRSGRHPMAYPASKLVRIAEELSAPQGDEEGEVFPGSA